MKGWMDRWMRRSNCHLISPFSDRSHCRLRCHEPYLARSSRSGAARAKGISVVFAVTKKIPGTFCRNIINPLASHNVDDP